MTASARPSLDLVRQATDSLVLDQLLVRAELTRAEIAAETGISKPTVSESMRRLVAAGLAAESGRQVGKRGPAGTNYRLRDDLGVALSVAAGPAGVVAEVHDLRADRVARVERPVPIPTDGAELSEMIIEVVTEAVRDRPPVRGCAVSLAGPVDQATGRFVALDYAPFLLDELDPRALLANVVEAPLQVDNDVNWAALAEHHLGNAQDWDQFVYCYLGPGLGAAVMIGGRVMHGLTGLAGELAHVRTTGPDRRSVTLLECLEVMDLLVPRSRAVDEAKLEPLLIGATAAERRGRDVIVAAVADVVGSVAALLNPAGVLIGGPWGTRHGFAERVAGLVTDRSAIRTVVRPALLVDGAPLVGARIQAVRTAQASLTVSL